MSTRREFLAASAATLFAGLGRGDEPKKSPLGIVIHSYPIRPRTQKDFADPLTFLEFCRERGAAGVQLPLGALSVEKAREVRAATEKHGTYVEGSTRAPKDAADVERFEKEIATSRECGATVVRTVMSPGRRYETFHSAKEFAAFTTQSLASLRLAEPVMTRQKVALAVENHKDFRTDELIDLMKAISSQRIGVCVDTGNSIALLERPTETATALAPWAKACHLKDMGVEESSDGFLLAEVPLGEGLLDLKAIVATLNNARPALRFSLEMITRDPLRIPCLSDGYWATMDKVLALDLARTLSFVKVHEAVPPLPRISKLKEADQLMAEDNNVRKSLEFSRKRLGI
ncbi:MAG TPA: sugar phosphate isomerase/epimerase family protein [Gemmataceae bacterium]|jgi:sugar phosphate isomerase/epimerase|nr:sugar phosphate isomerase/epimerase family protein [Gemmataceae bacterium]